MDTSKEYIKMCQKATEIQKLWIGLREDNETTNGFWFVHRHDGTDEICIIGDAFDHTRTNGCDCCSGYYVGDTIWLPRQDQLQHLMNPISSDNSTNIQVKSHLINRFISRNKFKSFERAWLAFIMQEKFKKVWNGEDWVKA